MEWVMFQSQLQDGEREVEASWLRPMSGIEDIGLFSEGCEYVVYVVAPIARAKVVASGTRVCYVCCFPIIW